jgi:hypothetical protein
LGLTSRPSDDAHTARQVIALGIALPAALYLACTLGFGSPYSQSLYNRSAFLRQYTHGVYRYRVLGRELVLFAGHVLHALGLGLQTTSVELARGRGTWGLFVAITVVNGVAFVAFTALVYARTVRSRRWTPAYLVLVTAAAASSYVVTPYDFLSYLLIAAAILVAVARRAWSWQACLVLAVLGTATRESFFVAVAAVVAIAATRPGDGGILSRLTPSRTNSLACSAWSMAFGSVGTYVGLRVGLSGGGSIVQHLRGLANFNLSSTVAIVIAFLLFAVLILELPPFDVSGRVAQRWYRESVGWLWVLSIPYVGVSAVGGNWFETPRLLLPIAICQYLVRFGIDASSSVPPAADSTEA